MNVLAFLGIAKVGRVASLLIAVSATAAAGGVWAGIEWQRGQHAQTENRQLRDDATTLRTAAELIRARAIAIVQDMQTSAYRMEAINEANWEQLNAIDDLYEYHRSQFDRQLETAAAAELLACRLGALGMRHWNEAAAGFTADPAAGTGADSVGAPNGVSADAADAGQRHGQRGDPHVAEGGASVPPMPREGPQPDRGRP